MTPYYQNGSGELYLGDVVEVLGQLPERSVHCAITSPPYWGLRDYKVPGQHGLEPDPRAYIDQQVRVFRAVRRVLRDDGLMFVNIGDSYASTGRSDRKESPGVGAKQEMTAPGRDVIWKAGGGSNFEWQLPGGFKPLDLIGIPHMLSDALLADGWYRRSEVIWPKQSPMPESLGGTRWERCRMRAGGVPVEPAEWLPCPGCPKCLPNDGLVLRRGSWRPTSSYEYILMFSKTANYWSDGEAVREPLKATSIDRGKYGHNSFAKTQFAGSPTDKRHQEGKKVDRVADLQNPAGRNLRNVWHLKTGGGFDGQHYATFPGSLVERCIRIATGERGVCPKCGAQWARVVETPSGGTTGKSWHPHTDDAMTGNAKNQTGTGFQSYVPARTIGWRPTCTCSPVLVPVPATVLDPYCGSCTTNIVAQKMDRRHIGIDLSLDYIKMGVKRLQGVSPQIGMGV